MRVLITWGSKRGGTAGIAAIIGESLERRGFEVELRSAEHVDSLEDVDAVIVGGALYANCWPGNVRRFVRRYVKELREVPVWFFSSGPLDDSADKGVIPPTNQVAVLAERVGAKGHMTFGGRLEEDAEGFPASAMAKDNAGDWRNLGQIEAWAAELADALPLALPGPAIDHRARSLPRLIAHGVVGWLLCAVTMSVLLQLVSLTTALVIHAVATPLYFIAISHHYFAARGAREPTPTALVFTGLAILLDLVVVAGLMGDRLGMFTSIAGTWLPFALIFLASWITGNVMATMPWPEAPAGKPGQPKEQPG